MNSRIDEKPEKHYLVNLLIKSFHDRKHNGTEYILAELIQVNVLDSKC